VLPHIAFRQWTLSLPWELRWDVKLLRAVERCLTKAIFLQPHTHLLVAGGVWNGAAFVPLPPPDQEEVEAVLARLLKTAGRRLRGRSAPTGPLWRARAHRRVEALAAANSLCQACPSPPQ